MLFIKSTANKRSDSEGMSYKLYKYLTKLNYTVHTSLTVLFTNIRYNIVFKQFLFMTISYFFTELWMIFCKHVLADVTIKRMENIAHISFKCLFMNAFEAIFLTFEEHPNVCKRSINRFILWNSESWLHVIYEPKVTL